MTGCAAAMKPVTLAIKPRIVAGVSPHFLHFLFFEWYWGKYMNYGTSTNITGAASPLSVRSAWYSAAQAAYKRASFPSGTTVNFAVAGDSACHDDMIRSNSTPGGTWFYESQQVYP